MRKVSLLQRGFTIVELVVVIAVIGVISAIVIVSYQAVITNAKDQQIASDLAIARAKLKQFATKNGGEYGVAAQWYSGNTALGAVGFVPSEGNIVDITTDSNRYCVRVYNAQSKNDTLDTAAILESVSGACSDLQPSNDAVIGSGGTITLKWKSVATGGTSACGIAMNNQIYCWGGNASGMFGRGNSTASDTPAAMTMNSAMNGKTPSFITTGISTTCVGVTSGEVYCAGSNAGGLYGNGNSTTRNTPTLAANTGALVGKTVKQLSIGTNHACAVGSDNLAYCWGNNSNGQLGNASTTASTSPVAVSTSGVLSGKTIQSIAAGNAFTCAVATDGSMACWGNSTNNRLNRSSTTNATSPIAIPTSTTPSIGGSLIGKTIKQVSLGDTFACAVASDDMAHCWGTNATGELGRNSTSMSSFIAPVAIDTATNMSGLTVKSVQAGPANACAIASNNKMYCWGLSSNSQVGNYSGGETEGLPVLTPMSLVSAGSDGILANKTIKSGAVLKGTFACAVASDNEIYCWGANNVGQRGNGTTGGHRPQATKVTGPPV